MVNDGAIGLTNVVLEVSILENRREEDPDGPRRVLVQPFIIRERVVLQPGYSMEYELQFRNLSAVDGYEARIAVVSVDSLANPKSR
jgi:hypothetical protein